MCLCPQTEPLLQAWPPFCAELALELWSDETELAGGAAASASGGGGGAACAREPSRYVRVLYNGARAPYTQGAVVARWRAVACAVRVCATPCPCVRAFHLPIRLAV